MPVKHPKVAVLLAAFNGMLWIEEQLASILSQEGVDVTIYISIDPQPTVPKIGALLMPCSIPRSLCCQSPEVSAVPLVTSFD